MANDIEVFGAKELINLLENELPALYAVELLRDINKEGAKEIRDEIKANAPVGDDGIYKNVKYQNNKEDRTSVLVGVGSAAYWARWLEFGTRYRKTKGRGPFQYKTASRGAIRAKPFVAPAIERSLNRAINRIFDTMSKVTHRFLKRKVKKFKSS